jgi:branched-chain amino acid transport system substrate-binding protein
MLKRVELVWALLLTIATPAFAADVPGVTKTEIKIGATFPFSGPASSLGNNGRGLMAYVQSINDRGGINGRKINLITLDDAYSPPKAVEQTRRLVESDGVAFIFGTLGTQSNSAIVKYLNGRKIPHLFVVSGATKFTNTSDYPTRRRDCRATTPKAKSTPDISREPCPARRLESFSKTTTWERIS